MTERRHHGRVKLLIVIGSLSQGGSERFVSNLAQHLDRTQIDTAIAVLRKNITYAIPPDTEIIELKKYRPWHLPWVILRLAGWIRKNQPDIVLSAWSFPSFITALALRITPKRPYWIARIASSPVHEETGIYRMLMRWLYRGADRFVANCKGIGEDFAKQYPFSASKLEVVWNPTPFDSIAKAAAEPVDDEAFDKPTIVSFGRLAPEKRHDLTVRAFKTVRAQMDARLVILGEGALRSRLQQLIQAEGVQNDVALKGFADNPFKYLSRATIYVQASDYEGLCNSLIEAQGLGIPVVATDCPFGPKEVIVNGQTGILVPTNDADALAREILLLLRDEARRLEMGAKASQRARECFDAQSVTEQWTRLLLEAAAKPTRP